MPLQIAESATNHPRWRDAAHQAAHALALAHFKVPFIEVRLDAYPSSDPHVDLDEAEMEMDFERAVGKNELAKRVFVALAAGAHGEVLVGHAKNKGTMERLAPDAKRWTDIFHFDVRSDELGSRLMATARALVQENISAITAIAEVLLEKGWLTGDEVLEITRRFPPRGPYVV